MEKMTPNRFLACFPDHVFRFIDQTGAARHPAMSRKYQKDLNYSGYEAYFTVNSFAHFEKTNDCKLENLTGLNAFFIDIDGRKDQEELDLISARLKPTFIVETMNGHHLYWLLDEGVFKDEVTPEEWDGALKRWEALEANIVKVLKGDPVVKDATRILRIPGTFYWKKTGELWKDGVEKAPFKIQIVESNMANRYSMDQVEEAFPLPVATDKTEKTAHDVAKNKTISEKQDFFRRLDENYPIATRDSFKALISGKPETLPPNNPSRNEALLVVASLARRAGWEEDQTLLTICDTGWHGMALEKGGKQEIANTIASAYKGGYTYGKNHPIIEWNMTETERLKMTAAYSNVMKEKREQDKLRFSTYEQEIFARHPYLKKNHVGIFFDYRDGVYEMLSDNELNKIILDALYDDFLWGFRTKKFVGDKIMCLLTLVPLLEETNDKGRIVNVKNGLLDIMTRELKDHDPEFVSLVQFPVVYDPDATCPTWHTAIRSWVDGEEGNDKSLILQQFAGYCLSSSTRHAKALFLIGDGGNGKSTYADTIGMLIGDRATSRISLEDIYTPFGLAGLIGRRLNIVEEISANYFHGHKIKALISGEEITVQMKYKDFFKFKPQAKFIFSVNQMPRVDDASSGMERRILAVQFKNNFRNNPNTDLRFSDGLLAKELSGILNWALDGAKQLHDGKNFTETQEKRDIIQDYREENSSVDGFIVQCTTQKEGSTVEIPDLYAVYREFCQNDGRVAKSCISFTKELRMHANKTGKMQYIKRENGKAQSKIEGIELTAQYSGQFQYRGLTKN